MFSGPSRRLKPRAALPSEASLTPAPSSAALAQSGTQAARRMTSRPPVAADKYYPADPQLLRAQLDSCLAQPAPPVTGPSLQAQPGGRRAGTQLRGLIVPHGSLQDSGMVAAAAYRQLAAEQAATTAAASVPGGATPQQPMSLLMLGTNHFVSQPPACLSGAPAWSTPLGRVPVDRQLCSELAAAGLPLDDRPHNVEHSIENQLPFLQHTLAPHAIAALAGADASSCSFCIAPVSVGWLGNEASACQLADQLMTALARFERRKQAEGHSRRVLLLATSDFTHAGPSYGEPCAAPWMSLREHCIWRDSPVLHAICAGSPGDFLRACNTVGTSLCGRWPVAAFLVVAQRLGWSIELLAYAPSDLYVQSGNVNGFAAFAAWG